jgi:hypothetical protein
MTPPNQLQQSPAQQPPSANFAPTKPLLELKAGARHPDSYIAKALAERFKHFHRRDRDTFREITNVGQLISLFFNGKQYPARNPIDGSWGVLPITGGGDSSRRALNVMNNLKQNLLTKWENSSPDIIIRPGRNLDTCASAAKSADAINNFYERQFYNHWFSQQEGLMGMTFGTYIDRYRQDDSKISMSVLQDVFEMKPVTMGEGAGMCGDCEYGGTASEFQGGLGGDGAIAQPKCPNCLSTAVTVTPPASDNIRSMSGQRSQQVGDLVCELLPMPACRWDLARRPEDSSWFIYRQRISKGSVTRVLGNVLLPQGEGDSDHGLDVLRALQHAGQALGGSSNYGNQRQGDDNGDIKGSETTFDEMWLAPDDYADINLIGDEKTVSGESIPKGKLTDYFPDGLCAVGLNGMAVVLALYAEKHSDHIVSGTWFTQAQTGSGRGLADSVEVQRQFNTMNNQARTYMSATYTPAIGYDNAIWTGSKMKYLGDPHTNIPFDLTKLPEGRKLSDSIYQFQPTAMPGQFFNYAQNFLNVMFQKTSMVSDFSNGEPGITAQNTTATAAEIDQGNADSINQPIFLIKADARRRGAEITIKLFRQHFPMKRYFDLGGRYGQVQGVELSSADLQSDLVVDVVPNSEMPKGPFTQRKNLSTLFQITGGGLGYSQLKQADPKLASNLTQVFDVDIDSDVADDIAELCRKRLNQMTQASKVGVTDPKILLQAIDPPIDDAEPSLDQKAKWFSEALDWDELQDAPMPLRQACSLLAKSLFQGSVQQQAQMAAGAGIVQTAAAAPGALGQQALEANQQQEGEQPPQIDPNAAMGIQADQQAQQADAETQAQQTQADAMESDAARQHEASESAKQRDHELKVKAEDAKLKAKEHANKVTLARMKPKPKPAAKGKMQ